MPSHLLEFRNLSPICMKSWRKLLSKPFGDRPSTLLVRPSFSNSEMFGLFSRVIVLNVEHHMLPQFSLSRKL
jgi:hypothetical protein